MTGLRLLVVVQRYGADIAGGSERAARELARRLAARGHHITVATSRARSYLSWADELPAGVTVDEGVRVVRFGVARPRDQRRFTDLQNRVLGAAFLGSQVPAIAQESWIRECGPVLVGLEEWLVQEADTYDAAIVFTYQYASAWLAARVLCGRVPLVLHPTAHPELTFHLDVFTELFAAADGIGYLTNEERIMVEARGAGVRPDAISAVCGVGVAVASSVSASDIALVRGVYGLGDRPYAVCVGRIDEGKGTAELVELHRLAASAGDEFPRLVIIGEASAAAVAADAHVRVTGFVPEADLHALIAGSVALVQPSVYESFSLVLCEAWSLGRPVLVTHNNRVLVGQVHRSGGGLVYRDLAEYAVMLESLVDASGPGDALGARGREYVAAQYDWELVLDRYEQFLTDVICGRIDALVA